MDTKKRISSRGIPSSESAYIPAYNSEELRTFEDKEGNPTRNTWSLDEVVNFIFSKKYQPKYHEISLTFMRMLTLKVHVSGDETSELLRKHGISKATFYNRVLPRLRRVGMVKIERETLTPLEGKRKFRPMRISLSKTFGNYFTKIGDSWLAIVDDARTRKS